LHIFFLAPVSNGLPGLVIMKLTREGLRIKFFNVAIFHNHGPNFCFNVQAQKETAARDLGVFF
jgi:hypothetical protein